MKRLALTMLVLVGGCFITTGDDAPCFGLQRTDQWCVFHTPGEPGYECPNLKRITYDGVKLRDNELLFDCRANDAKSTIQIFRPIGEVCSDHFVGGCIE
jgi:hypothetical protein